MIIDLILHAIRFKVIKTSLIFVTLAFSVTTYSGTGTVKVGIYNNHPKIYVDSNGEAQGFFVDLIEEIARQEGFTISYVKCRWNECLAMLEQGNIQILPDVAHSEERAKKFGFGKEAVISSWSLVFQRGNQDLNSILDLNEKKVIVLKESIQYIELKKQARGFNIKPDFIEVESFDEGMGLISSNVAQLILLNRFYGSINKDKYNLKETNILIRPSLLKFAFNKRLSIDFIANIDESLLDLKANKKSVYYKAQEKWLSVEPDEKLPIEAWLSIILLTLVTAVMLIMNWKLKGDKTVARLLIQKIQRERKINYDNTLATLIDLIEMRDAYTGGHSNRVATYGKLIASDMGYSKKDCKTVYEAGILHDIGKTMIPDSVLLKPGKLDDNEYKLIQTHAETGGNILSKIPIYEHLSDIVTQHHEHVDGSGYPNGLKGKEIHPLARILVVCDAFDAMTTSRIYKARKSIQEAVEEIKSLSGKLYDPKVVKSVENVLKDIQLPEVNQIPETAIEQMRFVYFYNDQLTGLFNIQYLNFVIYNEKGYQWFYVLTIHGLTALNHKEGWPKGDKILKDFSNILKVSLEVKGGLTFRIYGNDFVVMTETPVDFDIEALTHKVKMGAHGLSLSIKKLNLIQDREEVERVVDHDMRLRR